MADDRRGLSQGFLSEQLELARKAAAVLQHSYDRVQNFSPLPAQLSNDALIDLDALTSRFARLSDILLQKVFRAIDAIELVDDGTLIDRMNRAEKRGVIDSAALWREIRLLRNQIAHEYVLTDQRELFERTIQFAPELLRTMERAQRYAQKIASA